MIKQRVIKLAVEFSTRALDRKPSFSLKVLEHILMVRPTDMPDLPAYSEAVRELQSVCSHELQRLAMRYPDYFVVSAKPCSIRNMLKELTCVDGL
jgi:exportin-5